MEQINEKHIEIQYVRSDEAKRIISSLSNLNQEVIASHKKQTPHWLFL